jgi:hypothetical protein
VQLLCQSPDTEIFNDLHADAAVGCGGGLKVLRAATDDVPTSLRYDLIAARMSVANSSGYSHAAK